MKKRVIIHFENGTSHQVYIEKYDDIKMIVKGDIIEAEYRKNRIYYNSDQSSKELLPNIAFEGISGNVVEIIE